MPINRLGPTVTLTNGVNWGLDLGSICFVKFASKVGGNNSYNHTVTLNINSSGAKNIGVGAYSTTPLTSISSGYESYWWIPAGDLSLLWYNGTMYIRSNPVSYFMYSDEGGG